MRVACIVAMVLIFAAGCSNVPLRDGELVVTKNTTATIDDLGVARIKNQF